MKKILTFFILFFIYFGVYLNVIADNINIENSPYLNEDLIKKYENEFSNKLSKTLGKFSIEKLEVVLGKIDVLYTQYENKNLKDNSKQIIFSQLFVLKKIIKNQIEEKLKNEADKKNKALIEKNVKIELEKKLALEKERELERIKQEEDSTQLRIDAENRKKSEQERLQKEKEYEVKKQHSLLISQIEEQRQNQIKERKLEEQRQLEKERLEVEKQRLEAEKQIQRKVEEEKKRQLEAEQENKRKIEEAKRLKLEAEQEKQRKIEEERKAHIADSTYPGCNEPDIKYGNIVISSCNVGSTLAGTGYESRGLYFQWGRNKGFNGESSTTIVQETKIPGNVNQGVDNYGIVSRGIFKNGVLNGYNSSWSLDNIDDNWGGITNTNLSKQGPCATGYHVPSREEWLSLLKEFNNDFKEIGISFNLNSFEKSSLVIGSKLKLPAQGYISSGVYEGDGLYYWFSSLDFYYDLWVYYDSYSPFNKVRPYENKSNLFGFPVRCFKN